MNTQLRSLCSYSLNHEDLNSCLVLIRVVGADLFADLRSDQILHTDPIFQGNEDPLNRKVQVIATVDPSQFYK